MNFDFITQPFELRVNGKKRFKNMMGLFLSIISSLMTAALFLYLGADMYQRKNPRVLQKTESNIETDAEYELKDNNFVFAFTTENTIGPYERPDLFYLELEYYEVKIDSTEGGSTVSESRIIPYKKCTREHIPDEKIWNSFKGFPSFNCPDINGLKLGGNWDQEYNRYFRLRLYHCSKAENPGSDCSNDEELVKKVISEGFFLSSVLQEFYLDPEAESEPFRVKPVYSYSMIAFNLEKRKYNHLIEGVFRDDTGWIGNTFSYESHLSLGKESESFSQYPPEIPLRDRIFYQFAVVHIRGVEYFFRSFMKIPELLALIGGFNSIIILIFRIINRKFVSLYYPIMLVKELFSYSDSQTELKRGKTAITNNFLASTDKTSSYIGKSNSAFPRKKSTFAAYNPSKISILKSRLCCKKKVDKYSKAAEKGEDFIKKKIDVFYMVKWALKVEFFMSLLLDSEQYKALEVIDKPALNSKDNFLSVLTDASLTAEASRNALKTHFNNKEDQTEIDNRINLLL